MRRVLGEEQYHDELSVHQDCSHPFARIHLPSRKRGRKSNVVKEVFVGWVGCFFMRTWISSLRTGKSSQELERCFQMGVWKVRNFLEAESVE